MIITISKKQNVNTHIEFTKTIVFYLSLSLYVLGGDRPLLAFFESSFLMAASKAARGSSLALMTGGGAAVIGG